MADDDTDDDIAFIHAMTDSEKHEALVFLSGYSPDCFASVKARTLLWRERHRLHALLTAQQEGGPDAGT